MVSVELGQLYAWINAFIWPFFRIVALLSTAPVLGDSSIPVRIKLAFAVALTVVIAPGLPTMPAVAPASFAGLGIAARQVLIGSALGLTMRIAFAAVQTAGEFTGLQMGLSFASFFDPTTGANTAVLSRLMNIIAMLLFLALNGHLLVLVGLARTFEVLPISQAAMAPGGWQVLFDWSSQVLISGMLLALPLIIVLLAINLALGILNRTAQQLSVFAVGFPITLMVGLILLAVVLPQSGPFLEHLFQSGYEAMGDLTGALAGR
ncbi:MAG TPA: flagellar biosynthetic protein FliR [Burkholderiaceae bacterium]|nr:flagellar biosynthetic protein FliR [Burkholderiaceae bacterium]